MEKNKLATRQQLQEKMQARLDFLGEVSPPHDNILDWMDKNIATQEGKPSARKYIEELHAELMKAVYHLEDEAAFHFYMEKYEKAWLKIYQLMAKQHFHSRDIMDVDMRYYRHLPNGYSMTWNSKILGFKFKVFPRKPSNPPKKMKWITAGELLKIHSHPVLFNCIEQLEGWFEREDEKPPDLTVDEKPDIKLKFHKKDKHGFEWFK